MDVSLTPEECDTRQGRGSRRDGGGEREESFCRKRRNKTKPETQGKNRARGRLRRETVNDGAKMPLRQNPIRPLPRNLQSSDRVLSCVPPIDFPDRDEMTRRVLKLKFRNDSMT